MMADTHTNTNDIHGSSSMIFREDHPAPSELRIASSSLKKNSGEVFPPTVRQVSFDMEEVVQTTIPNDRCASVNKNNKESSSSTSGTSGALDVNHDGAAPVASPKNKRNRNCDNPFSLTYFWFSYDAVKLFQPRNDETPEGAVDNMLDCLGKALNDESFQGDFARILPGGKDALLLLSEEELTKICNKARHIFTALTFAKEGINACERFSFQNYCNRAVVVLALNMPREERVSGVTVLRWFRQFKGPRTFALPPGKKDLVVVRGAISAYFHGNADMHAVFLHHMTRYLRTGIADTLASVTAYKYFKETLLPIGAREEGYSNDTFGLFLASHKLSQLNQRTFEAWFRDVLLEHRRATSTSTSF